MASAISETVLKETIGPPRFQLDVHGGTRCEPVRHLRRTEAAIIYRKTGNFRAVESTAHPGIEAGDALAIPVAPDRNPLMGEIGASIIQSRPSASRVPIQPPKGGEKFVTGLRT